MKSLDMAAWRLSEVMILGVLLENCVSGVDLQWHLRHGGGTNDDALYSVAYGNDRFVAVGFNGTVLTSPDGTQWQPQDSGTSNMLQQAVFLNGRFLVGGFPTNLFTSEDGIHWAAQKWLEIETTFSGVDVAGKDFCALVDSPWDDASHLYLSGDGTNWRRGVRWRDWGLMKVSGRLWDTAFGKGYYTCIGEATEWEGGSPFAIFSTNGTNWSEANMNGWLLAVDGGFRRVTYGNGRFVAIGELINARGYFGFSDDGQNWWPAQLAERGPLAITYAEGLYVAVGYWGAVYTSNDGASWAEKDLDTIVPLRGVAFGAGTFVAVGPRGEIWQSDPVIRLEATSSAAGEILIRGPVGATCEIQASHNLMGTNQWQRISAVVLTNNPTAWHDSEITNRRPTFYRALLAP